ncbi:MAG: ATP-dependent RecD-like DNA helicase [Candidatus Eremiobacterota bacterium]
MITLEGTVQNIIFRNEASYYTVARIEQNKSNDKNLITVVGTFPSISTGRTCIFHGDWVVHKTYGKQFSVSSYEEILPTSKHGIEQYLSSFIKGIGPATAKKLVTHFGSAVFDVIEENPERLREIKGIKNIKKIIASFSEQREIKNVMTYLSGFDIPPNTSVKIYKTYGMSCIEILKSNPYQLAEDIWGIGFKIADRIARKMGLPEDSPYRIAACITYKLQEATGNGHIFLEMDNLIEVTARDLCISNIPVEKILLEMERKEKIIVEEGRLVFLKGLYTLECNIAKRLKYFREIPPLDGPSKEEILSIQQLIEIDLSDSQKEALFEAFAEGMLIITGGPGTGKTTILKTIILRAEKLGLSFSLAAPTGRAAKRLAETTGRDAMTVHRLLGYIPGENTFLHNEEEPLKKDLIIVDEASMLDIYLFYYLLKGMSHNTRLILVGDVDQLPSVGPGNILFDLIDSKLINTICLKTIFRQAEQSYIIINSHRINNGEFPLLKDREDFAFLSVEEPEEIAKQIISLCNNELRHEYGNPLKNVQVLSPMHRGPIGVTNLNAELQKVLNPPRRDKKEIKSGNNIFREGDKVMQIVNNYKKQVFNGDLGLIDEIDLEDKLLWVRLLGDDNIVVDYEFEELNDLTLAYACTIHKSQGSEYPAVVIPVSVQHYIMLQRNLLYTAVTRAEKKVVLVGTHRALHIAINNDKVSRRNTKLKERIISEFKKE